MPTKLIIVVRADLGMGRGKVAAQAAHAAVAAALASVGTAAFRAIAGQARAAGLPVQVIRDAGRTQVAEGTATCCAIGPAADASIDAVTGDLALL